MCSHRLDVLCRRAGHSLAVLADCLPRSASQTATTAPAGSFQCCSNDLSKSTSFTAAYLRSVKTIVQNLRPFCAVFTVGECAQMPMVIQLAATAGCCRAMCSLFVSLTSFRRVCGSEAASFWSDIYRALVEQSCQTCSATRRRLLSTISEQHMSSLIDSLTQFEACLVVR